MSGVQKAEFVIVIILAAAFGFITVYLLLRLRKQKLAFEKRISELEHELRYDFLTGTLTRKAFIHDMELSLASEPRGTLLIFDVNGFKTVNDTFGHVEGDNLIKRYSAKLNKAFSKNLVGRLGGDEFLVFIPGECDKKAINSKLKKYGITEFPDKPTKLTLTSCCGAAVSPNNGCCFEDLYKMADKALYRCKKSAHEIVYCK